MIKSSKPLTLAEIRKILEEKESEKTKQVIAYAKKFCNIDEKEAKALKEELLELNIAKLKEKHIVKIIDLMPEDASDVRKIFFGEDTSLEQNEIEKILQVVTKHK